MNTKPPECYTTDTQARCLRVELTATRLLVLPLDQFVFAELTGDDKEQKLHLVFATHDILIFGHVLRRIETAICRLELTFLAAVPVKYYGLIPDGQPRIREIVVTSTRPPSNDSDTKTPPAGSDAEQA